MAIYGLKTCNIWMVEQNLYLSMHMQSNSIQTFIIEPKKNFQSYA